MTRRSRLYRTLEKQSRKNLFLSLLGIIIVLFVITKFGIPVLANLSLFLSGSGSKEFKPLISTNFISSPVVAPLPSATNSAKITISGKSALELTIILYINDNVEDRIETDDKGNFTFDYTLSKGNNTIKAQAEKDNKKSDFSDSFNVVFDDAAPSITLNSPSDGQTFSKDQNIVNVAGTIDPQVRVTVNGFWAIVDDKNNFSYKLLLQNGENIIKIEAVDEAGNKTVKEVKVNYSP